MAEGSGPTTSAPASGSASTAAAPASPPYPDKASPSDAKSAAKDAAAPAAHSPKINRKVWKAPKPNRRLRVFALDPSIGKKFESLAINETVLEVMWEEGLLPGPVGEYLEVVDVDPASDRLYEPVDLNDRLLLAQDGWAPSEGNPKFHQQMVYAVGMTTINTFEKALGRKALWAKKDDELTRRLRIYPHALRTDNAYYSPDKRALLFGYFPSNSSEGDATSTGSMVFACLSSDIVAHEMTHALLDGLHRRFEEASNPDVPAFHEGFADIVALFQHFTIPELVSFEIARVRGNLMEEGLLAGLANQFGEASGQRGPLRNYTKVDSKTFRYPDVTDAHDRGSILVYAVYDAFRKIVDRRTRDLIRLSTAGTGLLPAGAIHPDLVQRLTTETCKIAKHVSRMCIRALDYCPPVDLTFGEYLRAIITADLEVVPDDPWGYRVAFMEAFRKWNILPPDVRTVSEETLAWNVPQEQHPDWIKKLVRNSGDDDDHIEIWWNKEPNRDDIFRLSEANCRRLHNRLEKWFGEDPKRAPERYSEFGLKPGVSKYDRDGKEVDPRPEPKTTFEVHNVRLARRVTPDGSFKTHIIVSIAQRRPVFYDDNDHSQGFFWFRGGAVLIIDPTEDKERICYSIIKNSGSDWRLKQQLRYMTTGQTGTLRALYFGAGTAEPFALMHGNRGDRDDA